MITFSKPAIQANCDYSISEKHTNSPERAAIFQHRATPYEQWATPYEIPSFIDIKSQNQNPIF